jgi:antitoxin component YwqK of YwqJK toxin-antitoxin module
MNQYNEQGEKEGQWEIYYPSGKLRGKAGYKDGKFHGKVTLFHENGKVEARQNYKDGECNGVFETYFKSGKISERIFLKNGEVDFDPTALSMLTALLFEKYSGRSVDVNF